MCESWEKLHRSETIGETISPLSLMMLQHHGQQHIKEGAK